MRRWNSELAAILFPMWGGYIMGVLFGVLLWRYVPTVIIGLFVGGITSAILTCSKKAV